MIKRSLWTLLLVTLITATIAFISKQLGWDPNKGYFIAILTFIVDIYEKLDDRKYEK